MGTALPVYVRNFQLQEQICSRELIREPSDIFDPLQQFRKFDDPQSQWEIVQGRAMFRFIAGGIVWVKRLNGEE